MLKDKEDNLTTLPSNTIYHRLQAFMINVLGTMDNSTKWYIYQHNKYLKDTFIAIINIIGSCHNTYVKAWVLNISRENLFIYIYLPWSQDKDWYADNTLKDNGCFPRQPEFNSQAFTCQLTIVLNTNSLIKVLMSLTLSHKQMHTLHK